MRLRWCRALIARFTFRQASRFILEQERHLRRTSDDRHDKGRGLRGEGRRFSPSMSVTPSLRAGGMRGMVAVG